MSTRLLFWITLVAALLMSSVALAGAVSHEFKMEQQGYFIIDFIVFVGVLWYFLRKPAKQFLVNRRAAIAKEMDEASSIKTDAEARLAKYESRLAGLAEEKAELQASFSADGERDKERIQDEAKVSAQKIMRDSERSVVQEQAKLREELELTVAERALEEAEGKIQKKMNPGVHRALVQQYIADLERIDSLTEFRSA